MPDPTEPVKPKVYTKLEDYKIAKKAWDDSTKAYNQSLVDFNDIFPKFKGTPEDVLKGNVSSKVDTQGIERLYLDGQRVPSDELGHAYLSGDFRYLKKDEKQSIIDNTPDLLYNGISPTSIRSTRGGTMENYFYPKPKQPVEYQKPPRPSYQQIPVKTPTVLPIQQATEEALQQSFVEPITKYPKDIQRYTAAKYLESQGKPSGYVNYGEGKGRKDIYGDGGMRNINNNDIGFLFDQEFGI